MFDAPMNGRDPVAEGQTYALNRVLRIRDGMAVTVGIVIGAGILRTPGLIAGYLGDAWLILAVWVLGGIVVALSTPGAR